MAALLSRRSPGWAIAMLRRASNRIPSIDLLLTVLLIPEWVHEVAGDDLLYCCEACMQRHPKGMVPCHSPGCDCGERMEREREQAP
jgi:hypothetical protein